MVHPIRLICLLLAGCASAPHAPAPNDTAGSAAAVSAPASDAPRRVPDAVLHGQLVWPDGEQPGVGSRARLTLAHRFAEQLPLAEIEVALDGAAPFAFQVPFVRDDVAKSSIGPEYARFMPFLLTQFFLILFANLLELNETQEGVLQIAFSVADDQGLLLLDLKDLRAMLNWVADNSSDLERQYGRISTASVTAILRRLLVLEEAGGERFFGEPAIRIEHLMQCDFSGRGVISILDATTLYHSPRIYATFLLWLLSELMEELPERGDADRPRLVFFFDEAHLLFSSAPKALLERITQVVRLIRSKGVGVFFITQYPNDVPDEVIGQLGNRIQHALRAFTPRDRKSVRAAAETFRANPAFDTEEVIGQLGVGEALVSTLDAKGVPSIVERTLMAPPRSQFGPIDEAKRKELIDRSPLKAAYNDAVDRESAFEMLAKREQEVLQKRQREAEEQQRAEREEADRKAAEKAERSSSRRQGIGETLAKSVARTIGSTLGRQIIRGILGSIIGRR